MTDTERMTMPNWVYTSATITGPQQSLDAFKTKASKPYTTHHRGGFVEDKGYDPELIQDSEHSEELSFWNFIAPTDLAAYYGPEKKPDNYESMTIKERLADAMEFRGDHWYDWNVRVWGTKWDACDVTLDEDEGRLTYLFSTAWSPAVGAFKAMVEQHPDLEFEFHNTEEQGWGVVFEGKNGELEETRSWDIPESHQDWIDLGEECQRCGYGDQDYLFDDCPRVDASANEAVAQ